MECHNHPGKESIGTCAVCSKPICEDCSVELAGNIYCKDCLEAIIGTKNHEEKVNNENKESPARLEKMEDPYNVTAKSQKDIINEDPYAVTNPNYEDIPQEDSYGQEYEINNTQYQQEEKVFSQPNIETPIPNKRYPSENQNNRHPPETSNINVSSIDDNYIYPDHSYQPEPRESYDISDKYERYLDDLYFDEEEVPLSEQLRRDEASYGPLTKKPFSPNKNIDETYENPRMDNYIPEYEVSSQYYGEEPEYYNEPISQEINNKEPEYYNEPISQEINNREYPQKKEFIRNEYQEQSYIPQSPEPQYQEVPRQYSNYEYEQYRRNEEPQAIRPIPYEGSILSGRRNLEEEITLEDQIRENIKNENKGKKPKHNIKQKNKEPFTITDILLSILLIILVLFVLYYILYLLVLSNSYPTFTDALFGLADPKTLISHIKLK